LIERIENIKNHSQKSTKNKRKYLHIVFLRANFNLHIQCDTLKLEFEKAANLALEVGMIYLQSSYWHYSSKWFVISVKFDLQKGKSTLLKIFWIKKRRLRSFACLLPSSR